MLNPHYALAVGLCIVRDRLARRYDQRLDLFCASHQEAKAFGVQRKKVYRRVE